MNLRPLPPQGSALPAAPHPDVMRERLLPDDLIIIPHDFRIVKHFFKKSLTNDHEKLDGYCATCTVWGFAYGFRGSGDVRRKMTGAAVRSHDGHGTGKNRVPQSPGERCVRPKARRKAAYGANPELNGGGRVRGGSWAESGAECGNGAWERGREIRNRARGRVHFFVDCC